MQVLVDGHRYLAQHSEQPAEATEINFLHKEPNGDGKLVLVKDGTTNEEIMRILVDRYKHLQAKVPCPENVYIINRLEQCLETSKDRREDRKNRGVWGTIEI